MDGLFDELKKALDKFDAYLEGELALVAPPAALESGDG